MAFVCLTTGLLISRFMISLGMLFFMVSALTAGVNTNKINNFFRSKPYIGLSLIFFLFLISGLWSDNTDYFLNRMRIKLPFLFLPFAFFIMPYPGRKVMFRMMLFFIGAVLTSIFWSILQFAMDPGYYIEIYGMGQILPTPVHHIRYSIFISTALLFCFYILNDKKYRPFRFSSAVILAIAFIFIIYQHLLAVRTGLMTMYIVMGCLALILAGKRHNRVRAISALAVIGCLLILSFLFVPTIRNKLNYMQYSLEQFSKGQNIRDLSDSRRLGSIYAGIELIKKNPLKGVGIGDIMDETDAYLEVHYPDLTQLELLPHNQYILTGASTGIAGMLFFIIITLLPLFYLEGYNDLMHLGTHGILLSSFMVEHTIESQIGVAAYIFIMLFSIKNMEYRKHA